jgi:tetratricopeptide (TPR) repeat protein
MGLFNFFKKSEDQEKSNPAPENERYRLALEEFERNRFKDKEQAKAALQVAYQFSEGSPLDRHHFYKTAGDYFYNLQHEEGTAALEKCKDIWREHIKYTPDILEAYKKKYHKESLLDFIPPDVPAFKRLAELYEEEGSYSDAVEVCDEALKYKIRDGTAGGFEGRKKRLQEKMHRR